MNYLNVAKANYFDRRNREVINYRSGKYNLYNSKIGILS